MKKIIMIVLFFMQTLKSQDIAPLNMKMETVKGEKTTLLELKKENPILISFWALWCAPCKFELKILQKLHDLLSAKGVTIVAINIDSPKSTAKVRAYISTQKYSLPILLDPNSKLFQMIFR